MGPRRTRASTAAQRRAIAQNATSRRGSDADAEEFKAEDPDSDHVTTKQTQSQTPQKPRTRNPSDDVLSGAYLAGAGRNSSGLSKRLKVTWETLQKTPSRQQQQEDGLLDANAVQKLRLVTAELLQEKLLKHQDKHVRSLVACCLVETMRVSSPDSPFSSNEELYRVFKLLCEQVRVLTPEQTTTSSGLHCFHVLESLATVRSCLLVVGLDFTAEGEELMMVQLFQALFDTLTGEHSAKIENLMLSIMVACIEESGGVEQPLLDVILRPLVGVAITGEVGETADNAGQRSPGHMARELIRRTSEFLQHPLSTFFNNILVDGPGRFGSQQASELKEHVYTLIYEVHKVTPSLLLYVLPNVCLQLQVDEVATRSDAIALMGKLFASSRADYGSQYMKNFRDFLGRFRDASKEIRLQMIQASVPIWESKTDLASLLEKEFILRLSDPEWEVRQLVVHELCDFAANCLDLISEECLRAVGERMKDKKVALRKETMTGLSQVYSTHISSYWEDEEEGGKILLSLNHRNIPAAHIKKLGWIPDYVLKCYAYPQQELKLRVIQLLDDFLLPKALSERSRANGLLFIYHSMDATSKEALRRVFSERSKCQDVCQKFVEFKVQHRHKGRATEADNDGLENAKQQLYAGLSPIFSDVNSLNKLLERLSKWKDHTVFKHIGELCDFSKSQQETRHARDQLVRSVGSKTPLGEFLKKLCRKLSLLTMNQATVATLLEFLILKAGRPSRENRSIVDLLVMASGELPELFAPFIHEKVTSILVASEDSRRANQSATSDEEDEEEPVLKDPRVVLGALHILANYARHWSITTGREDDASMEDDENATPSPALAEQLHNFCLGDSDVEAQNFNAAKESRAAELAAFTIAHFYGNTEETMELINRLCSKEKLDSPKSSEALPALQSLEVLAKRCSNIFSADQPLFARLWAHLLEDLIGQGEYDPTPGTPGSKERARKGSKQVVAKLAEVRCLAIKVAVNLLVYCRPTGPLEEGEKLIKLLFEILRSDGKTRAPTPALTALFRATASCGLMKMTRNRQLEACISTSEWHLLGFTMQDSSEDVRRKFLKKMTSRLMKQPIQHPHKYLSYLALAATDSNTAVKKIARNLLKVAIERMRRMFDSASSRESEASSSPSQPSANALMVPEYALPYVIHLLAHHPHFPVKLLEKTAHVMILQSPLWTNQLGYLGFFLDGLVSTNGAAADNIAFLLQILTKLSQCHDVLSPESKHIYPLIDSAVVLLKKKIKKQSNLKPFPGKIFLPKHLYSPGRPGPFGTPGVRNEPEAPETLGAPAGSRLSTSLSPIKPMDFAAHFMKLNSPPGSSLKSSLNKRKRSLLKVDSPTAEAEGKQEGSDDDDAATPPRRQSLLGQARPEKRTFADDSSDSGAESDVPRSSASSRLQKSLPNGPTTAASPLRSVGSAAAMSNGIEEEEEGQEASLKKRMTHKGTAADSHDKPRLRSSRRLQQA
ncbi:hypothetical protein PRIC2_014405 [Phytophthora ramorum]